MRSVCICGSQRYKDEIRILAKRLRELGVPIVFEPNFERHRKEMINKPEEERLESKSYRDKVPGMVYEHFERLRKADVCYVYNKDGYIGVNTTLEIGFAHARDMIIYALQAEPIEICRDILFTEIIETPEELVKRLT